MDDQGTFAKFATKILQLSKLKTVKIGSPNHLSCLKNHRLVYEFFLVNSLSQGTSFSATSFDRLCPDVAPPLAVARADRAFGKWGRSWIFHK